MYFEGTEYFVFLLCCYASELLRLLLQRKQTKIPTELKAKTPWDIIKVMYVFIHHSVGLQYNRVREFG